MAEPNTQKFRVILTGGGSGGHVYPLLAVADALHERLNQLEVPNEFTYLGPRDAYGVLFNKYGISVRPLVSGKIRRYFSLQNIIDIPKFLVGLIQALWTLYVLMPDMIFSKGGTGAGPVVIAGWFYRIPIVIHESDAQPGLTNLASAHFVKKICVSFERAAQFFNEKKVVVTGTPIRQELLQGRTTKQLAKETLGFNPSQPLTVVMGGSQGSVRINEFIVSNLPKIVSITQVLHQTGVANFEDVQKLSHAALVDQSVAKRYQPINYFEKHLAVALTAADIVVTRAGSGSIFELAAFGVPSLLIPIDESANDHQRLNAYEFAKNGAALVIEEQNLLPGIFFAQLQSLLGDPERLAKMSAAASRFFMPDAAQRIAETIIQIVTG